MDKNPVNIMDDLQQYINFISKKIKIKKVILFGSYAKGEVSEGSDIDIAIISPELGKSPLLEKLDLYEWRYDSNITNDIQPVPISEEEYECADNFFINEIRKTGIDITKKLKIA